MKTTLHICIFISIFILTCGNPQWNYLYDDFNSGYGINYDCNHQTTDNIVWEFRKAIFETSTLLYKKIGYLSDGHFIFSPFTIWRTLAGIAEGTNSITKQELFYFLNLPEDFCDRQTYYKLAQNKETISDELKLKRNRKMIINSNSHLNTNWERIVRSNNLIDISTLPYKSNAREIEKLRKLFNVHIPNLNLNGNSLIFDSLDYEGLWASAFENAAIENGPFYNGFGDQIGNLEYMKMIMPVKMGYVPKMNLKVLELPIADGRYRILFALPVGKPNLKKVLEGLQGTVVFDALMSLRQSSVPIEIVIPRIRMTSEIDVRKVLEDVGISSVWNDPSVTRNISNPAAQPSAFVQRITATFDTNGLRSSIRSYSNLIPQDFESHNYTDVEPILGRDFIANRPFLFGLMDTETYLASFAGMFSKP